MASNGDHKLRLDLRWLRENKKAAYEFLREYIGLEIAAKLRNLRESSHLTQEGLAGLLGSTQSAVARWENEDYRKYSLSTLQRIAEAYGLWPTLRFEPHEAVLERILAGRDWADPDRSPVLHVHVVTTKLLWERFEPSTQETVEAAEATTADWREAATREVAVAP